MGTKSIDEREVLARGFVLAARNVLRGQSLWYRDDEPHRSFSDDEVLEWIEEHPEQRVKGKKAPR